ncbi:glycoside hydrolase family 99-like domain-containing protein [uncultured Selenomonas sp.]|uniref:glycosyltransferase WbsX family protein n=1 Tax=uncultured Selenomonas sp. TaxID=159275 RepID=UPI0026015819|nr:glycoside hydrolase family 99-like domain-containing protein [uncultured Selenomonas sp.]
MRVLAMYLPQFHRVRENDAWWGEGFTEWTTVRSAEPLFPRHEQPKVPMNHRYYNLLDPETMRWQAELMHRYDVDGMCFYHYYFKDGRRILERPAENLLRWKDIDMPFCFSWANESWVRSWSRMSQNEGNPWSAKFDGAAKPGDDGILLTQAYGDEVAWRAHYAYLSPFFHDLRYILHDNMPLFLIYKPDLIPCLREMLACWDELARAEGFDGVYVVGTNVRDAAAKGLKGVNLQEPQDTMRRFFPENYQNPDHVAKSLDYAEVWQRLVNKSVPQGISLGGFAGYDDTPRRGHGGSVIRKRSPEIFQRGMIALLRKAETVGSPYIFLNAWNEWGEGMYLEPDEKDGLAFLEALKAARKDAKRHLEVDDEKMASTGASSSSEASAKIDALVAENATLAKNCDRYRGYWTTMETWIGLLETGGSIATWLRSQGIQNIAIYGLGMMGKHLLYQLQKEKFSVYYAIDQQTEQGHGELSVYALEDELPDADAVLVTVLYDYPRIRASLEGRHPWRIWALDEVLRAASGREELGGTK